MESFCDEHGLVTASSWARAGLAETLFDVGRWDEVLRLTDELLGWEHEHGPSMTSTTAVILAGWVEVRRGDVDAASDWTQAALDRSAKTGVAEYEAPAHALAAEVAMMRDDEDLARHHLEGFGGVASKDRLFAAAVLPVVSRLFVRLGDPAAARTMLESLPDLRSRRERLSAMTVRAVIEEAEGDVAAAAARLEPLVQAWREYGFPLEVGLTGTALARCLHTLGRHDEAARVAAEAAEVLADLGAAPLVRAASDQIDPR
jgi:tetratricopeptide (TPR) repeat protein